MSRDVAKPDPRMKGVFEPVGGQRLIKNGAAMNTTISMNRQSSSEVNSL